MTGNKLTAIEAFDADELLALARLDIERNELEAALYKLKRILSLPDAPAEGVAVTARLYAQLGLFGRAQRLYEQFLQAQPEALIELFQLGMTHFDAGQPLEALTIWERVLKQSATHPPALFYKGLVLAQQGKIADARQTLDVLLKSAPADNLYFSRAKELLQAIDAGAYAASNVTKLSMPSAKEAYRTEH